MIRGTILGAWPLFVGVAMIMLGNGLQGTLLGIRAAHEGFGTLSIGIIMSMYYAGFLLGSLLTPKLLENVGHIRVFAAMSALASITILLHGVFLVPLVWTLVRILTGLSFAALYIVIESWLNALATQQTRGRILGAYLVVHYLALALGQYFLYMAPPESIHPFILTSVLISLAALPLALSRRPAPVLETPSPIRLRKLWHVTPLGFVTVGLSGVGVGALFAISPVYGTGIGLETSDVVHFMAIYILGGICGQIPLGMLSDRIGRRAVIIGTAFGATALCLMAFLTEESSLFLYVSVFGVGFTSLTMYGLGSAYCIDHLKPHQYISAGAAMILINGAGAVCGPLIVASLMDLVGIWVFFPFLATVYLSLSLFAAWRSTCTEAPDKADMENFTATQTAPTPILATMAAQIAATPQEEATGVSGEDYTI